MTAARTSRCRNPVGDNAKTHRVHQREHTSVAEAQPLGALVLCDDGLAHGVEVVFTDQAVVAQRLDV